MMHALADSPPDMPPEVAAVFAAWPAAVRKQQMAVRALIFSTAAATRTGPLSETLKWGQPAYLTEVTRSGASIRLGFSSKTGLCAIHVHCQTTLVGSFRDRFEGELAFEGNRAIVYESRAVLARPQLAVCLAMALCYRRRTERLR